MLKNILKIGKPLSKVEQQSINGGIKICYHCGYWIPCDHAYNDDTPCGIRPL